VAIQKPQKQPFGQQNTEGQNQGLKELCRASTEANRRPIKSCCSLLKILYLYQILNHYFFNLCFLF